MKLFMGEPYKSISTFEEIELPDFVLVTGANGVGKSHLLEAIYQKHIHIEHELDTETILHYPPQSLLPKSSEQIIVTGSSGRGNVHSGVEEFFIGLVDLAKKSGEEFIINSPYLAKYDLHSFPNIFSIFDYENEIIKDKIQDYGINLNKDMKAKLDELEEGAINIFNSELNGLISKKIETNIPLDLDKIRRELLSLDLFHESYDSIRNKLSTSLCDSLFTQNFETIFTNYQLLRIKNKIIRLRSDGKMAYTDEEFKEKFGGPPWEKVNEILELCGLNFKVTEPIDLDINDYLENITEGKGLSVNYTFALIPDGFKEEITTENLSSGEKILMSIVFCMYNMSKPNFLQKPDYILFDEPDASLHPQMSKHLIEIIRKNLVIDEHIKVIMTTHSPSTVAVASEGSIFVMEKGKGLVPSSNQEAVDLLTENIPTLSIDTEARRYVLVESHHDADCYENIFTILKKELKPAYSLTFIGVGSAGKSASGCAEVKSKLSHGVRAIHGIIDWDGKNKPCDRLHVLAEKYRYTLENCILDPLLIAAIVIRMKPRSVSSLGLPPNTSYTDLKNLNQNDLQALSDTIVNQVLGESETAEILSQEYLGGLKVNIRKDYLNKDGKILFNDIINKYKCLLKFKDDRNNLLKEVSSTIMNENSNFIPILFYDLFKSILDY